MQKLLLAVTLASTVCGFICLIAAKRSKTRLEATVAKKEELEKRLENVTGVLASVSQPRKTSAPKKGKNQYTIHCIH